MGQTSDIEWCDSTQNAQMGCDGCELWNPKAGIKHCYAGILTERMAGSKGWPASFDQPEIFSGRIQQAIKWPDLTGKARPGKPWLRGLPRLIFLDDMGDTFTESLPIGWLGPEIKAMEASPHIWIFLTKRARRMRQFFEQLHKIPDNFWLGVSVTSMRTMARAYELAKIEGAKLLLSVEPLLEPVDLSALLRATRPAWILIGGESGPGARPMALEWARSLLDQGRQAGIPVFVKQLGSAYAKQTGGSSKGGDWTLWPEDLRVREVPQVEQASEEALWIQESLWQ